MKPRLFLAAVAITVAYLLTGCGPLRVHGDYGVKEHGAQQSTVTSMLCRGQSIDEYFIATNTPDARRIEMRDVAERERAAGKCQAAIGGGEK